MKRTSKPTGERAGPGIAVEGSECFLSPRQLAGRWDCSPTTAQRIAMKAGIAKYFLGEGRNGMVRYLLREVEAYEEKRRAPLVTGPCSR